MDKMFLESLGLEAETIDKILGEVDKAVVSANDFASAEKAALQEKTESLESQLNTANSTIQKLKNANKDNESLQEEIDNYKNQIDELKKLSEANKIEYAVDLALERAGAINPATVKPLINMDMIMVGKDGKIAGVEEQIQSITANKDNAFLFRQPEPTPAEEPKVESPGYRGGYEPLAADKRTTGEPKESSPSLGALAAEFVKDRQEKLSKGVTDFWPRPAE